MRLKSQRVGRLYRTQAVPDQTDSIVTCRFQPIDPARYIMSAVIDDFIGCPDAPPPLRRRRCAHEIVTAGIHAKHANS